MGVLKQNGAGLRVVKLVFIRGILLISYSAKWRLPASCAQIAASTLYMASNRLVVPAIIPLRSDAQMFC